MKLLMVFGHLTAIRAARDHIAVGHGQRVVTLSKLGTFRIEDDRSGSSIDGAIINSDDHYGRLHGLFWDVIIEDASFVPPARWREVRSLSLTRG